MAASFPVTFPSALTTTPTTSLSDATHNDNLHVKDRDEIRAVQSKVGLGTTSPTASATTALVGTGGTQSGWYQVGPQHIAPGTTTILRLGGTVLVGTVASVAIAVPSTYRHLNVVGVSRVNGSAAATVRFQINGDTGANYDSELISLAGTFVSSSEELAQTSGRAGIANGTADPSSYFAGFDATFYDYTSTTRAKEVSARTSYAIGTATANKRAILSATTWRGTAAIGTITILPSSGSFVPGSSFDVYGVPG